MPDHNSPSLLPQRACAALGVYLAIRKQLGHKIADFGQDSSHLSFPPDPHNDDILTTITLLHPGLDQAEPGSEERDKDKRDLSTSTSTQPLDFNRLAKEGDSFQAGKAQRIVQLRMASRSVVALGVTVVIANACSAAMFMWQISITIIPFNGRSNEWPTVRPRPARAERISADPTLRRCRSSSQFSASPTSGPS